ncbi:MAG: XRE family transcriptional regulator [Candidatus Magnetoovum sp. WYHC-5]|nr:XRE family transcriptional regulator [Candidatus Magnetoovum sp. WYHC-5]
MSITDNINKLLKDRQLKPKVLEDCTGLSRSYIWQILQGERIPKFEIVKKIADCFEITIDELYFGKSIGVPIVGVVSAGDGILDNIELYDSYKEYLPLPPGYTQQKVNREGVYGLVVRGESMSPVLRDGYKLYIKPYSTEFIKNNDIVVIHDINNQSWMKQIEILKEQDFYVFKSLSNSQMFIKKKSEINTLEKVWLYIDSI